MPIATPIPAQPATDDATVAEASTVCRTAAAQFPVKLRRNDGESRPNGAPPCYTYDAYAFDGELVAEGLKPLQQRPPVETMPAMIGQVYVDADQNVSLVWCDEVPKYQHCAGADVVMTGHIVGQ